MNKLQPNQRLLLSHILGYEVSGSIVEVGVEVKSLVVGDKVGALTMFGGYSQYAVAKGLGCFKVPEGMKMAEAAGIPVAFCTAYHCLFHTGSARRGDRCLIHAAAGGVGLAAVQLAKHAGLVVYGTASNPLKVQLLKDTWNVDHVINSREQDLVAEVAKTAPTPTTSTTTTTTDNKKILDIVLDSVGGSQLKQDLEILRPGGRVVAYGAAGLNPSGLLSFFGGVISMLTLNGIDLLLCSHSFCGVNMKRLAEARPDIVADCLDNVLRLFAEGVLRIHIHKVYDWRETHLAHRDIESRGTMGKLIIQVTSPFQNKK
eukprot:TRINITY_DN4298_c0_g1_i25.p1 TRINITY_DN4298_c0_g1~~TRINITY_DN4298_c0_g1_i25.p1  ORF type:complete len:315 (-),score=75.94 TRINITY_DN4298_c0_g1_i25:136-1080(-)